MLVNDDGKVMLVRLEQFLNAEEPILVTESGIVTLVRLAQRKNVPCLCLSPTRR